MSPPANLLPTASASCPDLVTGTVDLEIDGSQRSVEAMVSDVSQPQGGPLVLAWHGVNETPTDALAMVGSSAIDSILAAGGAVIAPYSDPYCPVYPWWYTTGGEDKDGDLLLVDEVVACAIEQLDIDVRRIHSVGFGEGAMNTAQLAVRRSGYIASIAVHSVSYAGAPAEQLGTNPYPVMILHGGASDVFGSDFYAGSLEYNDWLGDDGDSTFQVVHFSFLCDHNQGHIVATDAKGSVWQFLQDHPYGTSPSPYANELPSGAPSYCALN